MRNSAPRSETSREHATFATRPPPGWVGRGVVLVVLRSTVVNAWNHEVLSQAAAAAFWTTLSLPPLLMGVLGCMGFVGDQLGPAVVTAVQSKILDFSKAVFSANVVDTIIAPTVADTLSQGQAEIASGGFLLLLWAGSSALASLVDSITKAHNQHTVRHTIRQRIVTLALYLVSLAVAVVGLPIIALGPTWLRSLLPPPWRDHLAMLMPLLYYPATAIALVVALTTLYHRSLPRKLPWHRGLPGALTAMLLFLCTSIGLRLYLRWVTSTGYTYGALAAPIAFLLFAFFLSLAIIIGAELNNAIEQQWPTSTPRRQRHPHHEQPPPTRPDTETSNPS